MAGSRQCIMWNFGRKMQMFRNIVGNPIFQRARVTERGKASESVKNRVVRPHMESHNRMQV